jgi:hypothetical protein
MRSDSYFLRPIIVLHDPVAIVLNLIHKRGIRQQKKKREMRSGQFVGVDVPGCKSIG